jgi:ABC-type polysaccharide/polyol phosphate transport system ATPase subunit
MALVELDHVSVTFPVRRMRAPRRRHLMPPSAAGRHGDPATPLREVNALQDVCLRFGDGGRIGIIGHNGAGKSTLLKVVAGVYPPCEGERIVEGRISSLFKIDSGFELDANGWENIAYRGYLQGETPKSIRAKMPAIAEFSELGRFLDMPVRYYSAGMLVRLAFSIATAIEPEILLVDEVLSVGDLSFQHKARQRMQEMIAKAELIIIVSHELETLPQLCDQGVWMDHGRVRQIGPLRDIIDAYTEYVQSHELHAQAA